MKTHAKKYKLIKKNAVIIPNSATIYGQLFESTFSLQKKNNNDNNHVHVNKFNITLEPMRKYRLANKYTVRYLNERNAVRQTLTKPIPLFDYDFQNYDISKGNFAYSCVLFKITEAVDGVFDSIGLFFNLYLDANRTLIVSNAPTTVPMPLRITDISITSTHMDNVTPPSNCWMQALYRVSTDVFVKQGDVIRIQIVQMPNVYIIGDVGIGESNSNLDSRLIRFNSIDCINEVQVYTITVIESKSELNGVGVGVGSIDSKGDMEDMEVEEFIGTIPAPDGTSTGTGTTGDGGVEHPYKVFASKIHQQFKFIVTSSSGKQFGMYYQLYDSSSTTSKKGKMKSQKKGLRKIPLNIYDIVCPSS